MSFYDAPEAIRALEAEAASWIGTPFAPHAAVMGAGVDCVRLAAALYLATGALREAPAWPKYRVDSGKHRDRSALLEWLENSPRFRRLEEGAAAGAGDLAVYIIGRSVHHAAVILNPRTLIHVLEEANVVYGDPTDSTLSSRLHSIWRPLQHPHP